MSENLITLEIFSGQPNNMGEAKLGKLKKNAAHILFSSYSFLIIASPNCPEPRCICTLTYM